MGYDISSFCPEGCSIAEVSEWPQEAFPNRKWCFIDGEVVPRVYTPGELREQATHKRNYLASSKNYSAVAGCGRAGHGFRSQKSITDSIGKIPRAAISKTPDIAWPESRKKVE